MKYLILNPMSQVPLYIQITNQIEYAIETGLLKHLDRLPTESFFERVYHVSPIVVKNAYALLKEKKLIETNRGSQAFVSIRPKLKLYYDLFSEFNYNIMNHKSKLIYQQVRQTSPSEALEFIHPDIQVLETKRIFLIDNFPIYFQINLLSVKDKHKHLLSDINLDKGIFSLNLTVTQHNIDANEFLYYPKKAPHDVATLLEININDPVHFFKYAHYENKILVGISYHYLPAQYIHLVRED